MSEPIVSTLANFAVSISLDALAPEVVEKLKLCVGDALECCLAPVQDVRSRAAFASIEKNTPSCHSSIFGTADRASARDAAFCNTVKGALTSRNDSSRTAICHPGSILIPVVFALGEERHASGRAVLEAILAGYETMIRLGSALVAAHIEKSWRNTALVAPFGAAFGAARAAGLDAAATASAASFACHFAGGVNEWAVAGTGEDVFQNGWGARSGIEAMRLAACGAPGCRSILEGESGLLQALGAREQAHLLTENLGTEYKILGVMHKPIDSCFLVQGPCQAAQKLLAALPADAAAQIEHVYISVAGQAKAYPGCDNNREIGSLVQGIMSISLGVASTLVNGGCDAIRWAPPVDGKILALMHKCELVEDPQKTAAFPALQGADVTVCLADGRTYTARQPDVVPLTPQQVRARFERTAAQRLGPDRGGALCAAVAALEAVQDISQVTALLH